METITVDHKLFNRLMYFLHLSIRSCKLNTGSFENYKVACDDLKDFSGVDVDYEKTLEYFKSRGGLSDCDILLNVPYSSN